MMSPVVRPVRAKLRAHRSSPFRVVMGLGSVPVPSIFFIGKGHARSEECNLKKDGCGLAWSLKRAEAIRGLSGVKAIRNIMSLMLLAYKYIFVAAMISQVNYYGSRMDLPFTTPIKPEEIRFVSALL